MKCVSCQSEIPDGSRFCGICGARQDAPAPAPAAVADASATTQPEGEDMAATLIQAPRLVLPVPAPSAPSPASAVPQSPAAALVAQLGAARPAPAATSAAEAPKSAAAPEPAAAPAPVPVVLAEVQGAVIAHVQAQTPSIIVDEALGAQTTDGGISALTKAAEPPAAAPAPAASAPAAEASKPAAEAPKPAAGAKVGGEGQFRETIWFMDAIDPEKLAASEEADIEVRQKELAEASKQSVDANVRQQYSLAAAGGRKPTADAVDAVKRAAAEEQAAAATGGKSNIVLVVAIIVVLGIAVALLFK